MNNTIEIEEDVLKNFLDKKRKYIEHPIYTSLGEFVSGISLLIALCTSDFKDIPIISTGIFKSLMFIVAGVTIILSVVNTIKGYFSHLNVENLYKSIKELGKNKIHVVNIIILRNNMKDGKYLLVKNRVWKCWLFPSYNYNENEEYDSDKVIPKIKEYFKRDIGEKKLTFTYAGEMEEHIKLCAGNGVYYRYKFYFYNVQINKSISNANKSFIYNGNKYTWMTLAQMRKNRSIVKKNEDVVNFVAELESLPFN